MIFSVENFVEIKLSRLPLGVKLTFKNEVLAKIALNMAHVYDVIISYLVPHFTKFHEEHLKNTKFLLPIT